MPEWGYSPEYKAYRDLSTGQWASRAQVQGWVAENIALADNAADGLARMMADDLLRVGDWQAAMRQQIKQSYKQQYIAGKGGIEQMTQVDWGSIGGMTSEQYGYLDGFAREVAEGKLSEST